MQPPRPQTARLPVSTRNSPGIPRFNCLESVNYSIGRSESVVVRGVCAHHRLDSSPTPTNPIHNLHLRNLEQTRTGMYKILGEDIAAHLKAKDTPGVFIQGLVVYSGAGDEVLYERLLDVEIVSQVASFCEERGVSLIAYSGDEIVSVYVRDETFGLLLLLHRYYTL